MTHVLILMTDPILDHHQPPLNLATQLEISTLKQMLQRLPIVLSQVKAGNTSIT